MANTGTFNFTGNSRLIVYRSGATQPEDKSDRHQGQETQAAKKRRRQAQSVNPYQILKLCHYQENCSRGDTCKFLHVNPKLLEGCHKPYRLCRKFPYCAKQNCPFVHFTQRTTAEQQDEARSHKDKEPDTQPMQNYSDTQPTEKDPAETIATSFQSEGTEEMNTD